MEFTNLRSERKSLNDRNENFVSINDKTWWQGCPPESESMPNFFNSPQIARIKKKQKCGPSLQVILRHVMFSDF